MGPVTVARVEENRFYRGVAQRIAAVRSERGLTQEQVAGRAGLNKFHLARIEAGAENLSLQTLSRLAIAMGVAPSAFLEGVEPDLAVMERRPRANARDPSLRRDAGPGGTGAPD